MTGRVRTTMATAFLAAALVAAVSFALLGCPSTTTETPRGKAEKGETGTVANGPSDPGEEEQVSTGPITSPPFGDETRAELMDAAREHLGTDAVFYVLQIYVQGDAALAELQPAGETAVHVVAFRSASPWRAVWSGTTTLESRVDLAVGAHGLSDDLIDSFDWTVAPSPEDAEAAMVRAMASMTGFGESFFSAALIHYAKGTDGAWYAWGWGVPDDTSRYESEQLLITRPKWSDSWETLDYGTGMVLEDMQGVVPANVYEQFESCTSG